MASLLPVVADPRSHFPGADMESDDEEQDGWWLPEPEELPNYELRALFRPLPGHINDNDKNEVFNLMKQVLFRLVPRGQPKQQRVAVPADGTNGGVRRLQRSFSAPRLLGVEHHDVMAYGGMRPSDALRRQVTI